MKFIITIALILLSIPGSSAPGTPLRFTTQPVSRVAVGANYLYSFHAIDSLGRPLKFSAAQLPAWAKFSGHAISGTPEKVGQSKVELVVSNGLVHVSQYFFITVYDKNTVNILPMGNSITNGTGEVNSYRRALWKMLNQGNYNFDFIGSWSAHHMGGKVPNPDFDMDHEGHSGWNTAEIFTPPAWDSTRGNIKRWLKVYNPDIVLIELGTNDVFQCKTKEEILNNLSKIIKVLQAKNNKVRVFVGNVIPMGQRWAKEKYCGGYSLADAIVAINNSLEALANTSSTIQSRITIVDLNSGIDAEKDLYDAIHPNDSGEKIMAERWFDAIQPSLKILPATKR